MRDYSVPVTIIMHHAIFQFCFAVRKKDRADLLELAQLANLKAKGNTNYISKILEYVQLHI